MALALIAVLAFVPDPFFRQRVAVTTFDNVDAVSPGAPIYFRGAAIGAVRSVRLDPDTRGFAVKLGVSRAWRPSSCVFAQISESNPLTPPRIELIALETPAATCPSARAAANCVLVPPAASPHGETIVGCRRAPDFFQNAAAAVAQITDVARSANLMAARLQAMMPVGGSSPVDLKTLLVDTTATLAAANQLTQRLDQTLTPGKGDVALTLANVRRASDHAASIDVASLNASLVEMKTLIAQNQQTVNAMLSQGRDVASDSKALLENLSASLIVSGANLQRTTDNLDALTERLSVDPTFALRGQHFSDPPAPKGSK